MAEGRSAMSLELICGNALDAEADALIVTIDGAARCLYGTIAQAFQRRWPRNFDGLVRRIEYPLSIGRAQAVAIDGDCPFRLVIAASTLHHVGVLSVTEKLRVVQQALLASLQLAHRHRAATLATGLLSGGWRLPARDALQAMKLGYERFDRRDQVRLLVCVRDEATFSDLVRPVPPQSG